MLEDSYAYLTDVAPRVLLLGRDPLMLDMVPVDVGLIDKIVRKFITSLTATPSWRSRIDRQEWGTLKGRSP